MTFRDYLMAARFKLVRVAPYYARVAYAVIYVEAPGLNTLGVDSHGRLYYDPALEGGWLNPETGERGTPWTVDELVAVLAHEMNHLLRKHAERKPNIASQPAWNIAGDAEINDDLEAAGFKLPGIDFVMPCLLGMPNGLTAEEYFQGMEKQAKENDAKGDGKGTPIYAPGQGPGSGNCGSVAHGNPEDHEESPSDDGALSKTDQDVIRRQVANDVMEHAKSTGKAPADLGRWAEIELGATVDWKKEIASKIRNAYARAQGKQDYTYSQPNFRRSGNSKFIFPATYQPIPNVAVVVDTSGSISQTELGQAIAEINGICGSMGSGNTVTVISCDSAVHSVEKVYDARQVRKLAGGGGTDMGVGITEAVKQKAEIIIVITDGWTPWPPEPPVRAKVIVGLLGKHLTDTTPEWCHTVRIDLEGGE